MTDRDEPPTFEPYEAPMGGGEQNAIYLDHHATTPLDPRVGKAMTPFLGKRFGNPHSQSNSRGKTARVAVETARANIASAIGADDAQIFWMSGATEANNLVLQGFLRANRARGNHLIVSAIEHKSVLAPAEYMKSEGFEVSIAPVDKLGLVDVAAVEALLRQETILCSIMCVNNEVGTIQPVKEVASLLRSRGVAFHTDASQAFGKIVLDPVGWGVDYMSLSAHKANGPAGVGALFVRDWEQPRLRPLIYGGAQERGLRPGTLPTPLCVGFGQAACLVEVELNHDNCRIAELRDRFVARLSRVNQFFLNGHPAKRVPHNIKFGFEGIPSMRLIAQLPDLQLSTVSACSSSLSASSHVLTAMGVDPARIACSVRIGLGRTTSAEDVDRAAQAIVDAVERIRARQR